MKKKLQLEILDPVGNIVVTHHFFYEAGQNNRLRLTITDNEYILDKDGKLVILTQEEILREAERKMGKGLPSPTGELYYYNTETRKKQTLFEVLIPVWTIACTNDNVVDGDKGCCVYITVEAEDIEHAKDKAMLNEEFMSHISDRKNFDRKYLRGHEPHGNYVIGKVLYFEGDPRL